MTWINSIYLISTFFFILGLKRLSSPATARSGNKLSSFAMLIAIIATLFDFNIVDYNFILIGLISGSIIGVAGARLVAMTSMPEMVALLNGFGGISSLLVGCAAYVLDPSLSLFFALTIVTSVIIGGVTFTGSLIAWGKLKEVISGKPVSLPGQRILSIGLLIGIVYCGLIFCSSPASSSAYFIGIICLASLLGIFSVMTIGGGDMPVVISLLNSYSGLAACAAGFVIQNNLLIVAGALVGASGIILTTIMCKAMNRSLSHVLFSGFGSASSGVTISAGDAKSLTVEDAYHVLEAATSVVVIPGYGLAVAQAQHVVRELTDILEENGCEVEFAIHPVAGRMPGHMNVLLAEANISYDKLIEMEDINPKLDTVDVCIVVGANDVVNPDALDNETSPIYGMPIIEASKAKTVFVLKRSMNPGFAGIQNPLFFKENTRMIFGDAKATVQGLIAEFKE